MSDIRIGVIMGSYRTGSFSRQIAEYLVKQLPESFDVRFIDASALPLYNQDLEEDGNPQEWLDFRAQLNQVNALLFVTPEHNRSVPAVLKNALDVGSRPFGQSKWSGKPGAVVSVSPGKLSGFGANHHLRQALVFLNVPVMQQPEAYIGEVTTVLDAEGNITNEGTEKFLKAIASAYVIWIKRFV